MTLIAKITKAVIVKPFRLLYLKDIMPKTEPVINKINQIRKSREKKKLEKS